MKCQYGIQVRNFGFIKLVERTACTKWAQNITWWHFTQETRARNQLKDTRSHFCLFFGRPCLDPAAALRVVELLRMARRVQQKYPKCRAQQMMFKMFLFILFYYVH